MLYNKLFSGFWMNVSYAYALREVFNYYLARLVPPISVIGFPKRGRGVLHPNSAKKQVLLVENTFFDL